MCMMKVYLVHDNDNGDAMVINYLRLVMNEGWRIVDFSQIHGIRHFKAFVEARV